jgi:Mrp family chromosome partitioning ATPase
MVSFTAESPRTAQVGANALLQAFEDVRTRVLQAEGEAVVDGIERALDDVRTDGQTPDLLNRRTNALVEQQVDLTRQPTVAWALRPDNPVNGNSKRAAALGLLVGAVLGVAAAYARASRRKTFNDPQEVARLYGAPLIGLVAAADSRGQVPAESCRFAAGAIERIRGASGPGLSLTFVSTRSGAEKSGVVAGVAVAMAESGARVLAIDADPLDGALTRLLLTVRQVPRGKGPFQTSPLCEGLAVLPAGEGTWAGRTGASYARAMSGLLDEAKQEFDVIVIDGPSLLEAANAAEIADVSDAAVVVLGLDESVRDHFEMVDRLDEIGTLVVGCIIRKGRPPRGADWYRRRSSRSTVASPRQIASAPRRGRDGARTGPVRGSAAAPVGFRR